MKLFLTSSVSFVASDIVKHIPDLDNYNSLVFINTPAENEEGDMSWQDDDRNALIKAGFKVSDYTITGKNRETIEKDIQNFRFIYISGGDTVYFLKKSLESGFHDLIKELIIQKNKIYIGTSAGSIATGPKPHDYYFTNPENKKLKNLPGLNLVNFLVVPHWGAKFFKDLYLKGRMNITYHENQFPLILLTDYQYIEVDGDKIKIHDVKRGN